MPSRVAAKALKSALVSRGFDPAYFLGNADKVQLNAQQQPQPQQQQQQQPHAEDIRETSEMHLHFKPTQFNTTIRKHSMFVSISGRPRTRFTRFLESETSFLEVRLLFIPAVSRLFRFGGGLNSPLRRASSVAPRTPA